MRLLLGARGDISSPGNIKHKGAKWATFSIYVRLCDSPRVCEGQTHKGPGSFSVCQASEHQEEDHLQRRAQENQSVYPAGYSTCLYLNLFNVDLRREET